MNRLSLLMRRVLPLVVMCTLVLLIANVASACPNCKAGMSTNDAQAKKMAAGYYYSILFMLSMPFLIVTSFSGWMYFAVRKAKAKREAKAAADAKTADVASQSVAEPVGAASFPE